MDRTDCAAAKRPPDDSEGFRWTFDCAMRGRNVTSGSLAPTRGQGDRGAHGQSDTGDSIAPAGVSFPRYATDRSGTARRS
jgi:hypothetical protein